VYPSVVYPSVVCPSVVCPSVVCPSVVYPCVMCPCVVPLVCPCVVPLVCPCVAGPLVPPCVVPPCVVPPCVVPPCVVLGVVPGCGSSVVCRREGGRKRGFIYTASPGGPCSKIEKVVIVVVMTTIVRLNRRFCISSVGLADMEGRGEGFNRENNHGVSVRCF
jgi:hypothetical protein